MIRMLCRYATGLACGERLKTTSIVSTLPVLFGFIQAFDPDVVIATEVGVCELSALYKRQSRARFFLVGLELMDFNQAWVQPEVDLYPVAHPDLGEELIAAGALKSRVVVTGMPIDPIYAHLPPRAEMRARLKVRGDLPLILI